VIKLLAAAFILAHAAAAHGRTGCLSERQAADIVVGIAPEMIGMLRTQCAAYAGSTPFLSSDAGRDVLQRGRAAAAGREAELMSAIETLTGQRLPLGVTWAQARLVLIPVLRQRMPAMDERRCGEADRLVAAIAPLPPENLGRAAAAILALSERNGRSRGTAICRRG
jgi:hypothetical protein